MAQTAQGAEADFPATLAAHACCSLGRHEDAIKHLQLLLPEDVRPFCAPCVARPTLYWVCFLGVEDPGRCKCQSLLIAGWRMALCCCS